MDWYTWLSQVWSELVAGQRLIVPRCLPHPRAVGFEVPPLAEPAGQAADWVISFDDGSRVHVHEFANGHLVAHRDATDPKRGPLHAVWHWATESTSGRVTLSFAGAAAVGFLVAKTIDADRA